MSFIVVVPDDVVVEPERAHRLTPPRNEGVDIVVACAGHPHNLDELKRSARDARFLLAPAGMSAEDLREFAMGQTQGDIVTLLPGVYLCSQVERAQVATG